MLLDPRMAERPVSAVAYAAGFNDLSHFNRLFRSHFGMTPSGRRPPVARAAPITRGAHDAFMLARAALIVTDPDDVRTDPAKTLAAGLGLTRAEGRLAGRIGAGEQLKDAAAAEGITLETARTRLKSIFGKTGTHRQTELAILVAGLSR